jgi:hypothetical protein
MEVIQLTSNHQDQYNKFITDQVIMHNLDSNHLWQNVQFISETRKIFAVIKDDEIVQTLACNKLPNMPWSVLDTQISKKGLTFFNTIKDAKRLYKLCLDTCEADGIWGHWYMRDARLDYATKHNATTNFQGANMSRYGLSMSNLIGEKYLFNEAAVIKAGNLTDFKLYNHLLNYKPLSYDVTIRFITLKVEYMLTIMKDKITYG